MLLQARICLPVLTAMFVAAAAAPAIADTGFYLGATAGESFFHQRKSDFDQRVQNSLDTSGYTVESTSSSLDKTDFAFGGLVGYRFTPEFSIEAAYVDLGKLSYKSHEMVLARLPFANVPLGTDVNIAAKAKGPTLTALGILPLSPAWEIYGRAGLFFSKVTLDDTIRLNISLQLAPAFPEVHDQSMSANSVDPLVGIGAAWHVADRVTLRTEYTRFINVGDKDKTGETNIDLFNAGVTYSFH